MGSEELADNILKLLKLMEAGNCYREEIIKEYSKKLTAEFEKRLYANKINILQTTLLYFFKISDNVGQINILYFR